MIHVTSTVDASSQVSWIGWSLPTVGCPLSVILPGLSLVLPTAPPQLLPLSLLDFSLDFAVDFWPLQSAFGLGSLVPTRLNPLHKLLLLRPLCPLPDPGSKHTCCMSRAGLPSDDLRAD